jgi:enoyl-[acyl-carrier protein] reductase/trans-2-enoyl-CoA reductase (NAD+)
MTIAPIVKHGVICANSNAAGCDMRVLSQINEVKASAPISNGPKRVLILGGSAGLGLASRISLAFGGGAGTINVSYEMPPCDKNPTGSAGFHNNIAFAKYAREAGLVAEDVLGDAFSFETGNKIISLIKKHFGQIDCLVYSLATGVRPKADGSGMVQSVIKTIGEPFTGHIALMEPPALVPQTLEVATEQEIEDTVYVMGGGPWIAWVEGLKEHGLLADGFKTIAYSYIGSEITYPVYFGGSLGAAKKDLHKSADTLHSSLQDINGEAYVGCCPAIVSKASVFIPGLSAYVIALIKVLKDRGEYLTGQAHLHRLMQEFLYSGSGKVLVDAERLIHVDDIELNEEVQMMVGEMIKDITPENFADPEFGDYAQYRKEFFMVNGFDI